MSEQPIPMRIPCPGTVERNGVQVPCGVLHIDEGEFATKPHHTHACQACGMVWRPAIVATVGVQFLPGYRNVPVEDEHLGRALPLPEHVRRAESEITAEDEADRNRKHSPEVEAKIAENRRRVQLPSEHPDHIHGIMCDGQDGQSSHCSRLRYKLFGRY